MWEKNKETTKCDKRIITRDVETIECEDRTIKWDKNKRTIKCVKRTIMCDIGTAQCEDGTVKCEKKIREPSYVTK